MVKRSMQRRRSQSAQRAKYVRRTRTRSARRSRMGGKRTRGRTRSVRRSARRSRRGGGEITNTFNTIKDGWNKYMT